METTIGFRENIRVLVHCLGLGFCNVRYGGLPASYFLSSHPPIKRGAGAEVPVISGKARGFLFRLRV